MGQYPFGTRGSTP
uniref:Uncharacterized protein n=1 Tax=Anguilla anguilla TaxID=7936 RepID=A0A0E9S8I8_ANGAN